MFSSYTVRYSSALVLLALVTLAVYWQGLSSGFIFDDYPNLQALSIFNDGNDTQKQWLHFIAEGFSGTLGRPLSLFSFALQASAWPDNPAAFKWVNFALHLLNGGLLFALLLQIGKHLSLNQQHRFILALTTVAIWLLHPLNVSTVLYVVQRMTQLSTLFSLLGLLAYIHGRQALAQAHWRRGWLWMSLGIGLGGILATLSKENGILLILYTLVLEFIVLQNLTRPRQWHWWASVFLYAPLFLLIVYFSYRFGALSQIYQARPFSLTERLLTQPRVLLDYLAKLLLLRPTQFGLFQDDFPTSTSLINPFSTAPVILAWFAVVLASLWWRIRWPVFSFGVLWFLAGHVLESSFIPLLMYFEHRNYLPSMGILFALVYAVAWGVNHLRQSPAFKIIVILGSIWLCLLPLLTFNEARLWHQPVVQATVWAQTHPNSRLALFNAAAVMAEKGRYEEMHNYYAQLQQAFPEEVSSSLTMLAATCYNPRLPVPDINELLPFLSQGLLDAHTPSAVAFLVKRVLSQRCGAISLNTVEQILQQLLANPRAQPYAEDLYTIYAGLLAATQRFEQAIVMTDNALAISNLVPLQLQRVHWLIQAGQVAAAQQYLAQLKDDWSWWQWQVYQTDWQQLTSLMQQ